MNPSAIGPPRGLAEAPASASSPSPRCAPTRVADGSLRPPSARERQRGEDFERLLREKAARHAEDDGDADASNGEQAPAGPTLLAWPWPPLRGQHDRDGPAAGVAGGAPDGAAHAGGRADLEPPAQPPGTPPNAAGTWELTLRQPLCAPLDLRATRTAGAVNGWSLQVGSPTVDASVLARHAPRLNERLKARALTHTHVRIEEREPEDPS